MLTVQPGPPATLTLHPGKSTAIAGQSQPYHADGQDAHGNPLGDLTRSTTFTITPNGSCTTDTKTCTATTAGPHTVTGTITLDRGVTARGTATLRVKPGPLATLTLAPNPATIIAGHAITYQADGRDTYGNSLGDLTSATTFTITPDGSCTARTKTCTAITAGPHTVTGTITLGDGGTARGTATLTVQPGPPGHTVPAPWQVHHHRRQSQAYQDDGQDAYGNPLGDLTSATTFTIADGTCTASTCTATTPGPHTVTGTINLREHLVTGVATLQVQREITPGGPAPSPPLPSPSSDSSPPSPAPSSSSSAGPPLRSIQRQQPPAPGPFPASGAGQPPPSAPGGPTTSPELPACGKTDPRPAGGTQRGTSRNLRARHSQTQPEFRGLPVGGPAGRIPRRRHHR